MLRTRPADRQRYFVECYWAGVTEPRVAQAARRVKQAARDLRGEGRETRCLTAMFVPADEVAFYLFAAGSAQAVEEAYRRADLAFDGIVQFVEIGMCQGGGE